MGSGDAESSPCRKLQRPDGLMPARRSWSKCAGDPRDCRLGSLAGLQVISVAYHNCIPCSLLINERGRSTTVGVKAPVHPSCGHGCYFVDQPPGFRDNCTVCNGAIFKQHIRWRLARR